MVGAVFALRNIISLLFYRNFNFNFKFKFQFGFLHAIFWSLNARAGCLGDDDTYTGDAWRWGAPPLSKYQRSSETLLYLTI